MRRLWGFVLLLVTSYAPLVTIIGCGYTSRSMISNEYRTVYITPFVNSIVITNDENTGSKYRIYRPGLETDITRRVSNKYLFDGNLKPVKEENADLVLRGELVEFRKDPVRYDDNNNVTEYRVNLVVNMKMLDRKKNKTLWEQSSFTGDTSYFVSGPQMKSESQAINDALDDLARRIVELTVEQW